MHTESASSKHSAPGQLAGYLFQVERALLHLATSGRGGVVEIETAVEELSPEQFREFAAWFEERQALLNSADALFQTYDQEENAS